MSAIAHEIDLYNASTTVVFADVVEYVRLVQRDEVATVRRIRALLTKSATEAVLRRGGRVVQQMGDSLLLTFSDAHAAVACACELHTLAEQQSAGLAPEDRLQLRIGIHTTDILTDDTTVFGHGVNLAARIMTLAGPGQTIISSATRGLVTQGLDGDIEDMGDCYVKHVEEPVRAYRVQGEGEGDAAPQPAGRVTTLLPRLAVLPFEEYGQQATSGARILGVGDVVTDQLTAAFSHSAVVTVISRLSCHALRGRNLPASEVRRLLGADYVLSGRYMASGDDLVISAELMQTDTQQVLWSDNIRGKARDALAMDSDLIHAIARPASNAMIRDELSTARTGSLPNVSSHALFLFAVSVLHRFSLPDFERARPMLEALKDRAPRHPAPLAWLSRWHMLRAVQGWSDNPREDGQRALSWANRAIDVDPDSSLALTMLGAAHRSVERSFDGAIHYFERALELNPNEPLAWLFKGTVHGIRGDRQQALEASDRALALSPLDPMRSYYESLSATAAAGAGEFERAIALARSALRGNVNHGSTYRTLAICEAMLGRMDEARATVSRLRHLEPGSTIESFIARTGSSSPMLHSFADALRAAGLPAH